MKTFALLVLLSLASFTLMTAVDYYLGAKAEFLNAFSVLSRLLGQEPSVDSLVARKFGTVGEFVVVVVVNIDAGGILTILVQFGLKTKDGDS